MEENKEFVENANQSADNNSENCEQSNNCKKPNILNKKYLIIVLAIVYTVVIVIASILIDRLIIANDLKKSLSQGFTSSNNSTIEESNNENTLDSTYSSNTTTDKEPDISNISLNKTVSKPDLYELTVVGTKIGKRILPPNTSGYYTYYEAEETDHQYLDIKINYKNLQENEIDSSEICDVKIKYKDKYEYTSFSVIEDGKGNFTYSNITSISPLTIGKMHYLFDIPDDVANDDGPIIATITTKNATYNIKIR